MPNRIHADGSIYMHKNTPTEEKAFQLFYAGVIDREAQARAAAAPDFAATLQTWADKARAKAAAIDDRPPQGDLFGPTDIANMEK